MTRKGMSWALVVMVLVFIAGIALIKCSTTGEPEAEDTGTGGAGTGGASTGGRTRAGTGGAGTGGRRGAGGTDGSSLPTHAAGVVCDKCTTDNCVSDTDGCDAIADSADRQLCENLYRCFLDPRNACLSAGSAGDPLKCWCGDSDPMTTCATSDTPGTEANGPCLQQIYAAAKTTVPQTIKQRFVDPAYPIGRAVNLLQCRGNFCDTKCSVP